MYPIGRQAAAIAAKLGFVAVALLSSRESWATQASCSTTMALSNIGTGTTTNGCYTVDQTFVNLNANDTGSSPGSQSPSTVDISGSSTWANDATPWTNTVNFSGNTASGSNTAAPWSTPGVLAGTIYNLTNSTGAYFLPSGYPTPPAGESLLISSVTIAISGSQGSVSNGDVGVIEDFCIGSTACNNNTIQLSVEFANGSPVYGCSYFSSSANAGATCSTVGTSNSQITVTFTNPVATLLFTDQYFDFDEGAAVPASFAFSNTFGNEEVSPEPSMFGLLGAALAAIALFRVYRGHLKGRDRG